MDKVYLNNVINHIVKNITIDSSTDKFHPKGKVFFPWIPFPLSISREILSFFDSNDPWNARPNFHKYCRDNFGLNGKEMKIVLDKLNFIIKDKVKDLYDLPISRFNKLNESTEGKQERYLNYVYNDLVENTKWRDASYSKIDLFDDCLSINVMISWGSVAPYFIKIPDCVEEKLINLYGLKWKEVDRIWDKYEKHIIDMVLSKKGGISSHIRRLGLDYLNEYIEDDGAKFLNEQFRRTENFKSSMENLLNHELKILSKDSWINGEMLEEINSIKSIVVDDVIRNVGPYNFMVFVTLNVDINNAPFDLYKSIINYVEMMGNEIIPKFKIKYKINDITNRVPSNSPYLRESIEGKETEFLKKVVSRMVDETVPYNKREGVTSVVTPFVAHKETGSRWVLSADYCKRIVDDFDDNFTMGKIFIDYLDMYGLSYEEMEEVLYWYFNDVFEKYFSRFYDLSYKTRPRLDEGVDLGFVDKVVDRVLKEIVWDYDRGFVYFPMIDYSANIRDDDFLAPLMSDDPFSIHFRERNETSWHDDLMKHVEDIYGITGNEWNRVWGSLQGELWDKHVDWWNTFTGGY